MKNVPDRTVFWFVILLCGVLAGSTAVVMIKASDENPLLVASYRLLGAAILLTPFFLRDLGRAEKGEYGWKQVSWTLLPALALAVHFMTWVVGARMTQTSNASLIANLTSSVLPFFVWILFRERITRQELLGTVVALSGVVWMTGSTLTVSKTDFQGDLICFGSMLCYAFYMALGRKNGGRIRLWLYMVPLYYFAGLISLGCALFFVNPIKTYTLNNILLMAGLAVFPTVLGHTIMNYSLKHFRGQMVSVTYLGQFLIGTLLGYLFLGDVPRPSFFVAAAVTVVGILIVLNAAQRHLAQKAGLAAQPAE